MLYYSTPTAAATATAAAAHVTFVRDIVAMLPGAARL
jgi:hypothetical protein